MGTHRRDTRPKTREELRLGFPKENVPQVKPQLGS